MMASQERCFPSSSEWKINLFSTYHSLSYLSSDPDLSITLYQTWSSDARVYESHTLPELLPLLFDNQILRNPSVTAFLRNIAHHMVPQLVLRRRLDIIVQALK